MRFIIWFSPFIKAKTKKYYKETKEKCFRNNGFFKKPLFWLRLFSFILTSILCLDAYIFKEKLEKNNVFFIKNTEQLVLSENKLGFLTQKNELNSANLNIIQGNSLKAVYSPSNVSFKTLTSLTGPNENDSFNQNNLFFNDSKEIIEYIVEKGDNLSSLAQKFGISVETILWANNLNKNSSLKAGQKLIILPVSGVLHHVKKNDTLNNIAKAYKADVAEIITFNELSPDGKIYIGDILVIPNGIVPKTSSTSLVSSSQQTPLPSSYFIIPISSPYIISQGLHWYNAIDFTHPGESCGKPVLAAAGGQVLKVSYGWNMGAGNYLKILHPNGVITMYGHLEKILVQEGDNVFQGQIIALIGGKPGTIGAGKSSGCHLHFGVYGAKNPFAN